MMPITFTRSIRRKLILLFTATASFTVLIACTALWVYELVHYRATLQTEESAMAQLIADSSAPALLFGDAAAAQETLSLLRADARISTACLYDRHGVALAHFASLHKAEPCPAVEHPGMRFTRRNLTMFRSIEADSSVIGELYLEVSLAELHAMLLHFAETGCCVLVMTTIFALALSFVLERLISRPIIHLTEVATMVSKGGNYLLRAQHLSNDETGFLIGQFNLMMDRIQQREAELQDAHDGLDDKVRARTRDLRNEIAERKLIERDLESAKLAAEESNRAKSLFLANMSHELRTPLNAIIGYSEMLHEDAAEASIPSMTADLDKVLSSARHLLALISDILDLSKIEAGQMKVFSEPALTDELLQEVMATAEVLAKRNRNQLVRVEPMWRGVIMVDVLRFRQCLLNLISNACKFTEDGTISIAVERQQDEDRAWVLWKVSDTGIGISPADHAKLFRTFSQVDSSATRTHSGSGLGLVISQQLCQAMGGHITVESVAGSGSTFTIHIPDQSSPLLEDQEKRSDLVVLTCSPVLTNMQV